MSRMNRIRIINLNYNGNTIRIDDETFDLGGESTLLSLRNGGGKTVLVQMITSLFVNKKYRDTAERPFKSYFTTNRPTLLMVEWVLDNGQGYFLTGMMVRKCQNTEENSEELDMINFTGFYRSACGYDIENLPVIEENKGSRMLKGFGLCREEFERLKKDKAAEFDYYDMSVQNQRRAYFARLREYQINNREWESIIKKVNLKESGLSELFANAKDEKGLVEKWFLDAIENKLNEENDRVKRFQELAYKFICQYRGNQSKIKRKEIIEQYFADAAVLEKELSGYRDVQEKLAAKKNEIALFIQNVDRMVCDYTERLSVARSHVEDCDRRLNQVQWEKFSFDIYKLKDEKEEILQKRLKSEERITRSVYARKETEKELGRLQCAKLYEEAEDFRNKAASLRAELETVMQKNTDTGEERRRLGAILYGYYSRLQGEGSEAVKKREEELLNCRKQREENGRKAEEETERIKEYRENCGALSSKVKAFDTVEDSFNRRYQTDFTRNLLGEYEEGLLELCRKRFEEELAEAKLRLTKFAKEGETLLNESRQLAEEKEAVSLQRLSLQTETEQIKEKLDAMQEEKQKRLVIMRFLEAPEEELDEKVRLLERFERKIEEAEHQKEEHLEKKNAEVKEYENLKQGRVMELPENIAAFFEENGIDSIYGMEWLKKNGRSVEENKRLVSGNPFLPYSIIVKRSELGRLAGKEVYTRFPIPVIVREELEEALTEEKSALLQLGGIRFLCLFNSHLLDKKELAELLTEKQKRIGELEKKIAAKKEELKEYRLRCDIIQNQTFTLALIEEFGQALEEKRKACGQLEKKQLDLKEKQRETEEKQKKNQENLRKAELRQNHLLEREEAYRAFTEDYQSYCENRQEKEKYEGRIKEAEACVKRLQEQNRQTDKKAEEIRSLRDAARSRLAEYQGELVRFECYQEAAEAIVAEPKVTQPEAAEDYAALKARYLAITDGIAKSIESLNEDLGRESARYERKKQELERERQKYGLSDEEYSGKIFTEEEEERLEKELIDFSREENAAKEENIALQTKLSAMAERLKSLTERMREKTGFEETAGRKQIVETDFAARIKLITHEKDKQTEELQNLAECLRSYQNAQSVMAEYTEFKITCEEAGKELENISAKELNRYHGELRRDLKLLEKERGEKKLASERLVKELAKKPEYQEDFFAKGFENLSALTEDVFLMTEQLLTVLSSYESMLKKLEIDLENVDRERKNVVDTFFDYVHDIHIDMQKIDKNSTINIRGRSIKMLKIEVPSWENNREVYRVKMRDFVSEFIRLGIGVIERDENIEEFLGKIITTRRLYEEVVGIGNIGVRLYKIEADREIQISWAEVSKNSGGEGFLSAFVILISLLSYMRRNESELFASSEEGKVIIMDNPFAQTNAEHLLKPLMDMAKKTNTQLICLSGLGGESIYNRFDNIYVLKLIRPGIRTGIQYMKGEHRKGDEVRWMELSQMRVEQMELFEIEEE